MKGLWRRTPLGVAWLVALGMLATGLKLCEDARNQRGDKKGNNYPVKREVRDMVEKNTNRLLGSRRFIWHSES